MVLQMFRPSDVHSNRQPLSAMARLLIIAGKLRAAPARSSNRYASLRDLRAYFPFASEDELAHLAFEALKLAGLVTVLCDGSVRLGRNGSPSLGVTRLRPSSAFLGTPFQSRASTGIDQDSLSEMGEMESLRLQMAMDRFSKFMTTLSNLMKKMSDTSSSITQNLK